jgi:hypothetical protein
VINLILASNLCTGVEQEREGMLLRTSVRYKLYTFVKQNQLDALISQIYFWNETVHISDSSSVHNQELFTVHTAMVYVIQVF